MSPAVGIYVNNRAAVFGGDRFGLDDLLAAFMADYHRRPMDDSSIDRWLVWGPAEACAERLNAYVEAGATSFQCVLASVDQQPQMERVATELLPLLAD